MILDVIVCRAVAGHAELVKEIADFPRYNAVEFQTAEKVGLGLFRRGQETRFRCRQLSQDLAELTEFDQACVWIFFEVTLRQRAQTHELRIVRGKKIKVSGYCVHAPRSINYRTP